MALEDIFGPQAQQQLPLPWRRGANNTAMVRVLDAPAQPGPGSDVPLSDPVPGVPHGAIPGLLGVGSPSTPPGGRPGLLGMGSPWRGPFPLGTHPVSGPAGAAWYDPRLSLGQYQVTGPKPENAALAFPHSGPPVPLPSNPAALTGGQMQGTTGADWAGLPTGPITAPEAQPEPERVPLPRPDERRSAMAQAQDGGGLGGILGNFLRNAGGFVDANRMALLNIGAGMMGAQSLGQGLGRGFQMAAQRGAPMDIQLQQVNRTAQWLQQQFPNMTPQEAMMYANNPQAMQQIMTYSMGMRPMQWTQIGEDWLGNKRFGFVDPVSHQIIPFEGSSPMGGMGGAGGGGGTIGQGGPAEPPTGEAGATGAGPDAARAYLSQFPKEIQTAVEDYAAGRTMPTGRAGMIQNVQLIARTYGRILGIPVDDSSFFARKNQRTQFGATGAGTAGGQINFANTSIGHLADMSDQVLKLPNVGTGWMGWAPGSAQVAHGINRAMGSEGQYSPTVNAFNDIRERYVAEITKFYSGSPGAEAERQRAIDVFDSAKTPQELAAAIEAEAHLMRAKMSALDSQWRDVQGPGTAPFVTLKPESADALRRIETNVAKIRGQPAPTTPPGGQLKPMPQSVIDDARNALRQNKPRDLIIQRLQQQGYDPSGL